MGIAFLNEPGREGISQIELLVSMSVIVVLVALSLPAIGRARQASSRLQCRNNLRNLALGLAEFDAAQGRLPASGNILDADGTFAQHHSWSVSILPWVGEGPLYEKWQFDRPISDPENQRLARSRIAVFVCPVDPSRSTLKEGGGDQSYVVNGGVGFTVRYRNGVRDCPVDVDGIPLDLNGNSIACPHDAALDGDPSDRAYFKRMGLFFLENWGSGGTVRHYTLGEVTDGLSQTFMVTENVRVGYDPENPLSSFASPVPIQCAFYVGNPCALATCARGSVDYTRCNSGASRVNSGRMKPEGMSAAPNSFHGGGVNIAYADGHVSFLAESVDGRVYGALASPQGALLRKTPVGQIVVSDQDF